MAPNPESSFPFKPTPADGPYRFADPEVEESSEVDEDLPPPPPDSPPLDSTSHFKRHTPLPPPPISRPAIPKPSFTPPPVSSGLSPKPVPIPPAPVGQASSAPPSPPPPRPAHVSASSGSPPPPAMAPGMPPPVPGVSPAGQPAAVDAGTPQAMGAPVEEPVPAWQTQYIVGGKSLQGHGAPHVDGEHPHGRGSSASGGVASFGAQPARPDYNPPGGAAQRPANMDDAINAALENVKVQNTITPLSIIGTIAATIGGLVLQVAFAMVMGMGIPFGMILHGWFIGWTSSYLGGRGRLNGLFCIGTVVVAMLTLNAMLGIVMLGPVLNKPDSAAQWEKIAECSEAGKWQPTRFAVDYFGIAGPRDTAIFMVQWDFTDAPSWEYVSEEEILEFREDYHPLFVLIRVQQMSFEDIDKMIANTKSWPFISPFTALRYSMDLFQILYLFVVCAIAYFIAGRRDGDV